MTTPAPTTTTAPRPFRHGPEALNLSVDVSTVRGGQTIVEECCLIDGTDTRWHAAEILRRLADKLEREEVPA